MITGGTPRTTCTTCVRVDERAWHRGDLAVAHTDVRHDTLLSTFPVDPRDRCAAGCDGPGGSVVRRRRDDRAQLRRAVWERTVAAVQFTSSVRGAGGSCREIACGVDHPQIIPGDCGLPQHPPAEKRGT